MYKLIVEMTEEQQIILFEQLSQSPQMELPVKTVSLEETEASMRKNARKPCLIKANYRIQDRNYRSYILDISIGGVFIDANTRFPVGGELLLKFSLPNHPQPITFAGKIVWSTARGFGVKFKKDSVLLELAHKELDKRSNAEQVVRLNMFSKDDCNSQCSSDLVLMGNAILCPLFGGWRTTHTLMTNEVGSPWRAH